MNANMNTNTRNTCDATFATVPRFVHTVYDMLQNEDQYILSWSVDGTHFQVYDVPRLENEVLRKYFKHGKFSSFQRQLNNFGFHKWTKTRASVATFSHDVLVRCHPSQLAVLVSQMKLKQKTVTTTTKSAMVKPTASMKRPRSLLGQQYATSAKKLKLSPRDVCAVTELLDVSFTPFLDPLLLLEDGMCSSNDDLLLLDALDSVELTALDWDAVTLSFDGSDSATGTDTDSCISDVDAALDSSFEFDCVGSISGLTDADVSDIIGGLDTTETLLDGEVAFDVDVNLIADIEHCCPPLL